MGTGGRGVEIFEEKGEKEKRETERKESEKEEEGREEGGCGGENERAHARERETYIKANMRCRPDFVVSSCRSGHSKERVIEESDILN